MTANKKGLSANEVLISRKEHGANIISQRKKRSFLSAFISNLSDPIIRVLIGALFINIIFMMPNINWFETGGIAASILLATLVSTVSEHSSENAFERLRSQSENTITLVKRDGEACEIPSDELVVGDIVILEAGHGIYADMTVVEGEIYANESALTGESREIRKKENDTLLKGSIICAGAGIGCVSAVGEGTYYGKLAGELSCDTRPSPLKKRLIQLAKSVSALGYIAALLIALAYLFNTFVIDCAFDLNHIIAKISDIRLLFSSLLNALTLAVSIVVVAVPEGLPMMITVVLSSNMKRMLKDNVLVKKLIGIETSGNINLLFTDKTGTLTEGRLKVKQIHTVDKELKGISDAKKHPEYLKYLTLCACYCNSAQINKGKAIGSDSTDRAVLEMAYREKPKASVKAKIPFDSNKKYSVAQVVCDDEDLVLYKGAPERLISASSTYIDAAGKIQKMKSEDLEGLYRRVGELGRKTYRVVALGIKRSKCDTSLGEITFVGLLAIRDRVRKEAVAAVKSLSGAGVGVVMITGDNKQTAEAIAKECGIISHLTSRHLVIDAEELKNMTDDEISDALSTLAVISRALPSDKSRLVRIAQQSGYIVGMTGDGINDAPSLKSADVGFAMGSGTDVAKEAADIVIKDDNLSSIAKAVLYGRTIFESIRKFIVFQLTMNLAAVGISLIGPFIGVDNPVTVTQMLWVNIIMDTLGALAFASEPSLEEYMKRGPRHPEEKILSGQMIKGIVTTGLYLLILCVWFLKSDTLPMLLCRGDDKYILSAFFAMFIFSGIFVCFTSRSFGINILRHIGKNKAFLSIMLLISVMQMTFIYFGKELFRATPLSFSDLITVILISMSVILFDFLRKLAIRYLCLWKTNKKKNWRKA